MKKVYPVMLNVRVTATQREALRLIAESEEVSMSDIIREMIRSRLAQLNR